MWDPQSRSVQIFSRFCGTDERPLVTSQTEKVAGPASEAVEVVGSALDRRAGACAIGARFNASFDIDDSLDNSLRDDVLYPLPPNGCG
jgi:hypothetical protein